MLSSQLSVVRGLVRERTQQLGVRPSGGQAVFKTRRCRNSYGVACREPYSEAKHGSLPTFKNHDGRLWVENCIE